MGKKVKEYKSGDFIFAKVKGYPAWPARVQKLNGKKYFVYFYGTGETANLPPNMIFDYAENKDKFLNKAVKRRDFNDGVKQIEHDFANNVPLEQVIGAAIEVPEVEEGANDTANDSAMDTMDDSAFDTTAADDTVADTTTNTTQNDTAVEDSDDAGNLVIDEGKQQDKQKPRKSTAKTPAKEPAKTPKTPRGKKKEEKKDEEEKETEEKEEIVSRSGRKIRPKRYIDEQTEENTTLPSPAPKKRRGASPPPAPASQKEKEKDTPKEKEKPDKGIKHFNNVNQSDLEDLKEPFKPADAEKENILIAYLPSGQYVGIKLFQTRPTSFKNEAVRLQWDRQAASNAITLKLQLERGHITPQSIIAQLVMDLNLTDEEKASLDKERETEEKKSRVHFLKTEMKLIELDAKIKTCLSLEKADTDLCLKLIDELMELDVKPLMLLKHPTCLETIKRMRAYVGNTPSWDLSEEDAVTFSKQAHRIRKQADALYKNMKEMFSGPAGLSFWEWFSERVLTFKKATAALSADELLEMVHEPIEMSQPTAHTMQMAIDAANEEPAEEEKEDEKKKKPAGNAKEAKSKKPATPAKPAVKRQNSRKQNEENKDKQTDKADKKDKADKNDKSDKSEKSDKSNKSEKSDKTDKNDKKSDKSEKSDKSNKSEKSDKTDKNDKPNDEDSEQTEVTDKEQNNTESDAPKENSTKDKEQESQEEKTEESNAEESSDKTKENGEKEDKEETSDNGTDSSDKVKEGSEKNKVSGDKGKESEKKEAEKEKEDEPRAKRSRAEHKKTEPPPRSPAKRKSKA